MTENPDKINANGLANSEDPDQTPHLEVVV